MDIPEDVMKAARGCICPKETGPSEIPLTVARIARAILAERERCAKVAEADVPKDCAYGPGKGIAAAIRRGDT